MVPVGRAVVVGPSSNGGGCGSSVMQDYSVPAPRPPIPQIIPCGCIACNLQPKVPKCLAHLWRWSGPAARTCSPHTQTCRRCTTADTAQMGSSGWLSAYAPSSCQPPAWRLASLLPRLLAFHEGEWPRRGRGERQPLISHCHLEPPAPQPSCYIPSSAALPKQDI